MPKRTRTDAAFNEAVARAVAEERERIARAIEAMPPPPSGSPFKVRKRDAAQIARNGGA